jgi:uncharacterized Ntn-hydrolase superfamily protein
VTYSIVARDPATGELGVAVQSQAFNAGAAVCWARPGIGAIATQASTDRRYGWRGLERLATGASPDEALAAMLSDDDEPEIRQVAMLDADGRIAQHTGASCISCAGHVSGANWAAQGNMLASERAWHEMGAAFDSTRGTLAQRLIAALHAAEATGGDWRGRGGAGIVVVPATGEPWERVIDLRVEEGDDSLTELRRLVTRAEGYRAAHQARGNGAAVGRAAGLPATYVRWLAFLDAAEHGDRDEARRLLDELASEQPRWRDAAAALSKRPEAPWLMAILETDVPE